MWFKLDYLEKDSASLSVKTCLVRLVSLLGELCNRLARAHWTGRDYTEELCNDRVVWPAACGARWADSRSPQPTPRAAAPARPGVEKSQPTDLRKNQNSFKNALPRAARPLAVQKPEHAKGSQGVRSAPTQ